jgi:threonine synthase
MIVLETAQPAKFAATIHDALGVDVPMPRGYEDLFDRPQRSVALDADADAVKRYLVSHIS